MSEFQGRPPKVDDSEGKLFVGGLSWESTEESIQKYFEQFGTIESVNLKKKADDPSKHRGFCFVKFTNPTDADAVLNQEEPHMIDGSKVDPKSACPAGVRPEERTKKIFVGGLRDETTEEALMEYFQAFGEINGKINFKIDRNTQKRRGFCFIEFANEAIVDRIVKNQYHTVAGVRIETKRAQQPQAQAQPQMMTSAYGVQATGAGNYQPVIYIHPDSFAAGGYPAAMQSLHQPYSQNPVKRGAPFNAQRSSPYPTKNKY